MRIRNLIISLFTLLLMCSSTNTQKFNILIIGDSISIGYTPYVTTAMLNVANITHNIGNAQSTSYGVRNVKSWVGSTKWDIIQFNFGLWDVAYRRAGTTTLDKINGVLTATPAEYKTNLELIVQELIKTNAKLIFVNTTYIPVDEPGRFVGDEDIYNAAALEVMNKYGITVNNIAPESKNVHLQKGLGTNNVHYNTTGYQQLAALITAGLNAALVGMTPKEIVTYADWYISTSGNDVTGDGSAANPYLTLLKAYTMAADSDNIHVAAGIYTCVPDFAGGNYIAVSKSINILGEGAGNTIFQLGTSPVSAIDKSHGRFFKMDTPAKTLNIQDLSIRNCGWWGGADMGGAITILITGVGGVLTAQRCNFEGNYARYGGFLHCPSTSTINNICTFEDCYFGDNFAMPQNGTTGTTYASSSNYGGGALSFGTYATAIIKNCIFYKNGTLDNYANYAVGGNSTAGRALNINASQLDTYTTITNSSFFDNVALGAGTTILAPCINVATTKPFKFINNIVVDNTASGSTKAVDVYSNIPFSAAATAFANCKGNLIRTLSIDPLFVIDPSNNINALYTKSSAEVAVNGGNLPIIIQNNTGIKTIKATGTKVLTMGVFDSDVKSVDINGITRDPTVDVGAVQSSFSISGLRLNRLISNTKITVSNRVATIALQEPSRLSICSTDGKIVYSKYLNAGNVSIPMQNYGLYLVSISNGKDFENQKIIVY